MPADLYLKPTRCRPLRPGAPRRSASPKATNMTMPAIIPTSSAVAIISIISSAPYDQRRVARDLISLRYIFCGDV
jgi:hypothetical protein